MIVSILLIFSFQKPLSVKVKDPPIHLELVDMKTNQEVLLKDIVDDSFCFFLLPQCEYCENALALIETLLSVPYHANIIFLGDKNQFKAFQEKIAFFDEINVYSLKDRAQLSPHGFKVFPVLLAYRQSKLRYARVGPMGLKSLDHILVRYNDH